MMTQEVWMKLRFLKPLVDAGVPWAEIAREAGCDWRTARKYLTEQEPPHYGPRKRLPRMIDPFANVIDAWITAEPRIRAATIHERLAAPPYNFGGNYQRTKIYVRENRPRILAELGLREAGAEMHRRYEVLAGAEAQVDWGDEGTIATRAGELSVYSFHMTLSYSRDPFTRYVHRQDLATFWRCHDEAFRHFGGVPAVIRYDRTKTVVRKHVGRDEQTPLHPEAIAFAAHYGFDISLCAPRRPQAKGRVERQVLITREHVLAGRTFTSSDEMNAAWLGWLPQRRSKIHRTHGEVIAVRAERDRAALHPLPLHPYVVCDREIRTVGRDALISFGASFYSVPWRFVRPGQKVEVRITHDDIAVYTLGATPLHLHTHRRARVKGSWVVDERHWDGLPGSRKAHAGPMDAPSIDRDASADRMAGLVVDVARRALADYDVAATGGVR